MSFFVLMIRLLRATTYAINGLPSWSIISNVGITLERVVYVISVSKKGLARMVIHTIKKGSFIPFLSARKDYGSKMFSKNGQFWSACPKTTIKDDSEILWFWELCFWSLKIICRFGAVASFDAYQITNYQFFSKTHHFFVAWLSKNSRRSF